MTTEQVRQFLTQVELLHDREFNKEVYQIIYKALSDVPLAVGISVVKQMERSAPTDGRRSYLPSPKDLLHIVQMENSRLNPTPDKTLEALNVLPRASDSSKLNCRMACKLVGLMLSGKATRGQIIDMFDKAHEASNGAGWGEQGRNLASHYQRLGLKHDEKPVLAINENLN